MEQEFIDKIYTITDRDNVYLDEPMRRYTSFRIGGSADVLVKSSSNELAQLIELAQDYNVPYTILGNCSNVLVSDKGIRGLTILISNRMSDIKVEDNVISAMAGALLSKTAHAACDHSLAGMEFMAGIPGSVGGALLMNAGAYGGEIADILIDATVLKRSGEIITYPVGELDMSYRHSRLMDEGGVIMSARFFLEHQDASDIRERMRDLSSKRSAKQPLNYPSAGSAFKRPEGHYAAKLIDDASLRGYRVGDAAVSTKHAGFVVNLGSATALDVRQLLDDVAERVYEHAHVRLEPEIRFVGQFD